MPLTHLGCPSCGGSMALAEGQRLVACRYCGRQALAVVSEAVPRYVVALGVDRPAAGAAARDALRAGALPARIRRGAIALEWTLCYVPFYEVTGVRVGTVLRREVEAAWAARPDDREAGEWGAAVQREREDTRVIEKEFLRTLAACELAELGLEAIPLADLRRERGALVLEAFDLVALQGCAVVFAPTRPAAHARAPRASAVPGTVRTVEERVKILYYPVWHGRYTYAGRAYSIAVDGVRGAVLDARAPLNRARAASFLAGAVAVAALAWSRPVSWLLAAPSPAALLAGEGLLAAAGPALLGGLALGAAGAAWRMAQRGGEVRWAGREGLWVSGPDAVPQGALGLLLGALLSGLRRGGS